MGGRPRGECEIGSAPRYVQKGVMRPQKWEPQVGHQLQAVRYIREQLRTRRVGKFTENAKHEEIWEEPDASDVEDDVWTDIREE